MIPLHRANSVEANPKYVRDVIAVLGLEDSRPVSTPSVERTPTTESLIELENEPCTEQPWETWFTRARSVLTPRTARRKITCLTGSDEMNVKRIARYLKSVPNAKTLCSRQTHSHCL